MPLQEVAGQLESLGKEGYTVGALLICRSSAEKDIEVFTSLSREAQRVAIDILMLTMFDNLATKGVTPDSATVHMSKN